MIYLEIFLVLMVIFLLKNWLTLRHRIKHIDSRGFDNTKKREILVAEYNSMSYDAQLFHPLKWTYKQYFPKTWNL